MSNAVNQPASAPQDYVSNPFSSCFRGLDKLFKHNKKIAIVLLVISAVLGGLQFLGGSSEETATAPPAESGAGAGLDGVQIALIVALGVLILAAMFFVSVFIGGVISFITLKTSRGETTSFKEAARATFAKFWTLAGVTVLSILKILGGSLLLIVPGVRAGLRYQMALLPVFDDNLKAGAAMRRIKFLTKNHLMEVFGIGTVSSLIPVFGPLLQIGGEAVLYPQLKDLKDNNRPKPPTHWLNYLGFILLALITILIVIIVLAAISFV